jgi:hypothetical protein
MYWLSSFAVMVNARAVLEKAVITVLWIALHYRLHNQLKEVEPEAERVQEVPV